MASDMSTEETRQLHARPTPDRRVVMAKDQIMYSWHTTVDDCIPPDHRPAGPVSTGIIIQMSRLADIAPGTKGLNACKRLFTASIRDRQRRPGNGDTSLILEADLKNAQKRLIDLLNAIRDINAAVCLDSSFLRGHNLESNDPYDWEFETVVAFSHLLKLTEKTPANVKRSGNLWRTSFANRLEKMPYSINHVTHYDVQRVIDNFEKGLGEDQTTEADGGVSSLPGLTRDEQQPNSTYSSQLCTTGAIFQPNLPPVETLAYIGRMYYNARKQPASGFNDVPVIMTKEMASKGMYHDNKGGEAGATYLKHDGRNYSYKHFFPNMAAILQLERRFGKPFWEIFGLPEIQAQQAVRMANGILPTLAEITLEHRISQVSTLNNVCKEYFERYPYKPLTTDNVQHLARLLSFAARPDADGVKYKGWPSLGGAAAGPATPLAAPVVPQQQPRRRIREASPPKTSDQPVAKKPKPFYNNAAARAAYVANHVPDRDAIQEDIPYRRRPVEGDRAAALPGRSKLIVSPGGKMREVAASRKLDNTRTALTPFAPVSRNLPSRHYPEREPDQRIVELQDEGVQSGLGADEVQTTMGGLSLQDKSLIVHRDTSGKDPAGSSEMARRQVDANPEMGIQLYAKTAIDLEVFTKLGKEFQQKFMIAAEGLHSQMEARANQAENSRNVAQAEVQELKQKLQAAAGEAEEAQNKANAAKRKAEQAEKKAKATEERAQDAEERAWQAEERAHRAEKRAHDAEKRAQAVEKKLK